MNAHYYWPLYVDIVDFVREAIRNRRLECVHSKVSPLSGSPLGKQYHSKCFKYGCHTTMGIHAIWSLLFLDRIFWLLQRAHFVSPLWHMYGKVCGYEICIRIYTYVVRILVVAIHSITIATASLTNGFEFIQHNQL